MGAQPPGRPRKCGHPAPANVAGPPPGARPGRRGEVIAACLRALGRRSGAQANAEQARYYFGLDPQATPADIAAIVDYYPVFRIHYDN